MPNVGPRAPLQSSIPPIGGGKIIAGRFEVRGVLGEGGTGIVYDALRLDDLKPVALKVMHSHLAGDRQIRGRFAREANILTRLAGPNLCPILESGETDDPRRAGMTLLYMALPKLDGPALDLYLKSHEGLPAERAVEIMLEVCAALQIAHAEGIVHRDLKPANVILEHERRAIVVDFGMAKIVAGNAATTQLTQHNMIFGTPEYMAPEQARGDDVDERCDIYAAGIMLYEMLTGHVPFAGPSPLGVLTAHMTNAATPPRVRAPERGIPPALDALVMHALEKEPSKRYRAASMFASALHHARAAPDDVDAVAPRRFEEMAFRDGSSVVDPHGPTELDLVPSVRPSAPPVSGPPSLVRAATAKVAAQASRQWAIVWVIAALVGIAVGVWLSLASR